MRDNYGSASGEERVSFLEDRSVVNVQNGEFLVFVFD